MTRLTSIARLTSSGRSASSARGYPGKYKVTPYDSTTGTRILVHWVDPLRGTLWGVGRFKTYGGGSNAMQKMYRSDDNGATWVSVKTFGSRPQTINNVDQSKNWPDMGFGIIVLHGATPADDVLLVAATNSTLYDGVLYRSTTDIYAATVTLARAKFADDQGMGTGVDFWSPVGNAFQNWSIDANENYAVIGEYSGKSATGAWDRSVWLSSDTGATWKRIWFQPGDGSNNAKLLHGHLVRIDPDGGCWISFGDQSRAAVDDTDAVKGLWHSPAQPTPITSGKPAVLTPGDFTRVYSHTSLGNRIAARPITGFFRSDGDAKYFYVGEDSMTPTEHRTITRIRYDDASYTPVVKADYNGTNATGLPNGGIFGTCQLDDLHACAFATMEPVNSYVSRIALFVTSDGGETWSEDTDFKLPQASVNIPLSNAKCCCRYPDSDGYVWFGRASEDPHSFAYKPRFT